MASVRSKKSDFNRFSDAPKWSRKRTFNLSLERSPPDQENVPSIAGEENEATNVSSRRQTTKTGGRAEGGTGRRKSNSNLLRAWEEVFCVAYNARHVSVSTEAGAMDEDSPTGLTVKTVPVTSDNAGQQLGQRGEKRKSRREHEATVLASTCGGTCLAVMSWNPEKYHQADTCQIPSSLPR